MHRLQRLRDDHVVEGLVLEAGQPALDVHLDHVDAVADAAKDAFMIDLDAVAGDIARLVQITQEPAVAAPEVENALAGGNPVGDDGKVEAFPLLCLELRLVLGHTAMFSR
jgi:hypothetical protein